MNDDFSTILLNKISDLIDEKLNKFYEQLSNNFLKIDTIEKDIKIIKEQIFVNYPLDNKINKTILNNESIKEIYENQEINQDDKIIDKQDIQEENNTNQKYSCKFDNREKKIYLKIKKKDLQKNDIQFKFKVTNNGEISWPENCYLISNNEEITFDKTLINEGKSIQPNEKISINTIIKIKNIKEGKFICTSYIIDEKNNKIGNDIGYLYIEIENDDIPIKENIIDEIKTVNKIDLIDESKNANNIQKNEKTNELNEEKIKELEELLDENLNTSSIFSEEEIRNAIIESKGDLERASKILFPD